MVISTTTALLLLLVYYCCYYFIIVIVVTICILSYKKNNNSQCGFHFRGVGKDSDVGDFTSMCKTTHTEIIFDKPKKKFEKCKGLENHFANKINEYRI